MDNNQKEQTVNHPNKLFFSAYLGKLEDVIEALEYTPIDTLIDNVSPLVAAISEGHEEVAAYLISRGANIHLQTAMGTPLTVAIDNNLNRLVEKLISSGADINQGDDVTKASPLLHAVCHNNLGIVKHLLQKGCDIKETRFHTHLAILNAIRLKADEITSLLIQSGVDVNAIDNTHGITALVHATVMKNTSLLNSLLDAGADPNLCDCMGNSPLLYAASDNDVGIMTKLLASGADVNLLNKAGVSCYTAAPFGSDAEKLILQQNPMMHYGLKSVTKKFKQYLLTLSQSSQSPFSKEQTQLLMSILNNGYCYGYALLRLLARSHQQNKPFTEALTRIAKWDGDLGTLQSDQQLIAIFNSLLTELLWYHHYQPLPHQGKDIQVQYVSQLITDEVWEVNETHEFMYKRDELAKAIPLLFAEADQMIVFNHNHAIALAKSAKYGYVIYNLASDVMKLTAKTEEALADKLLSVFDEKNRIAISFEFIRPRSEMHNCHLDQLNQYCDQLLKQRLLDHEVYLKDGRLSVLDVAVINQNNALFDKVITAETPPPESVMSALALAVQINNLGFIKILHEIDSKQKSVVDYPELLRTAAILNNHDAILYFVKAGIKLPDSLPINLYNFAIKNNNLATVKALYHLGLDLFAPNNGGLTPLAQAKAENRDEIAQYIWRKWEKLREKVVLFQPQMAVNNEVTTGMSMRKAH